MFCVFVSFLRNNWSTSAATLLTLSSLSSLSTLFDRQEAQTLASRVGPSVQTFGEQEWGKWARLKGKGRKNERERESKTKEKEEIEKEKEKEEVDKYVKKKRRRKEEREREGERRKKGRERESQTTWIYEGISHPWKFQQKKARTQITGIKPEWYRRNGRSIQRGFEPRAIKIVLLSLFSHKVIGK